MTAVTESLVERLTRLDKEWDKPVDFQGYSAVVMSSRELLRSGAGKWEVDAEARETFVLLIDALPELLRLVKAAKVVSVHVFPNKYVEALRAALRPLVEPPTESQT